jgi:N5-(carboxyethyl)ornithine synthase
MNSAMNVAFIRPNYPNENRVAILPEDLASLNDIGIVLVIEAGFGSSLNIPDSAYASAGARIVSRAACYMERAIFNLKLTQPSDYGYLRPDHVIIGWTHPYGSGAKFYAEVSAPLGIALLDIDSVMPRIFRGNRDPEIADFFPRHMFWKNSYNAGIASVRLAMRNFPILPEQHTSVCVLGSGAVAQGAFYELSRSGFMPRMFYRKTLDIFHNAVSEYHVIVNGIEVDTPGTRIMDANLLKRTRGDVIIVEAAADAGNAIEGTEYQSLNAPIAYTFGRRYLMVNNAPTVMVAEASRDISAVVTRNILPCIIRNRERLGL